MIQYNKQQQEAILHENGPMLVLAGPGCGKTAVITGRVKHLIETGVSPSAILVATFTRAAADEMKERFLRFRCKGGSNVQFGTLHGIFYQILKRERHLEADCILAEEKKHYLLRTILEGCTDEPVFEQELAESVAQEISYIKGNGIASRNFYSKVLPAETFRNVFDQYRRYLAENRKLDFDDINTAAWQLLHTDPSACERWQGRFGYILIDEFQDINPLQYALIRLLAEPENNLFIVGDDDQSIYRFRGSDPAMMLDFPEKYPDCRTVRLEENYRSTPQILSAAGKVIRENKKRYEKKLRTVRDSGAPMELCIFPDVWQETDALAQGIREAVGNGASYSDIAVLVRTNFGARAAIEKLLSDRIPFTAQQEIPCIFDHFIAKDLFAYLAIAEGSRKREDFVRICNRPNRFLSRQAFYEAKVRFENLYIYYEDRQWMWPRIEAFEQDIHALSQLPPYGAVQYLRKVVGYDDYIRTYASEKNIPADELFRLLDEITESAKGFPGFAAWNAHAKAYAQEIKRRRPREAEENTVKISTLHGSKGKEYDIVYILDVNEGNIPFHKAAQEADIEEERRLLYVGMTRAAKELKLYAVKERFEKKMVLSSFLNVLTENGTQEEPGRK